MFLRQTLAQPVNGYWDGGKKQVFDWRVDGHVIEDSKGQYVRIGSFDANFWFHVAWGKTMKLTLSYAKRYLKHHTRVPSVFEYVNETK